MREARTPRAIRSFSFILFPERRPPEQEGRRRMERRRRKMERKRRQLTWEKSFFFR